MLVNKIKWDETPQGSDFWYGLAMCLSAHHHHARDGGKEPSVGGYPPPPKSISGVYGKQLITKIELHRLKHIIQNELFTWSQTLQGEDYWYNRVYASIENMIYNEAFGNPREDDFTVSNNTMEIKMPDGRNKRKLLLLGDQK